MELAVQEILDHVDTSLALKTNTVYRVTDATPYYYAYHERDGPR
jgi:hypothetical protein